MTSKVVAFAIVVLAAICACSPDVTLRHSSVTPEGRAYIEMIHTTEHAMDKKQPMADRIREIEEAKSAYATTLSQPVVNKTAGIGMCLSGGGFRATLFTLGAVWAVRDMGLLSEVQSISGVSGGSITAAQVVSQWRFATGSDGEFLDKVAIPLLRLTARTVDIPAIIEGILTPGLSVNGTVASILDRRLYKGATVADVQSLSRPQLRLLSSAVPIGQVVDLAAPEQPVDGTLRTWDSRSVTLGHAVAASAAFPPFLAPARWRFVVDDDGPTLGPRQKKIDTILVDGGVLDNMASRGCSDSVIKLQVDAHVDEITDVPRHLNWLSTASLSLDGVYEARERLLLSQASIDIDTEFGAQRLENGEQLIREALAKKTSRTFYVPLSLKRGRIGFVQNAFRMSYLLKLLGNPEPRTGAYMFDPHSSRGRCLKQSTRLRKLSRDVQVSLIQWGYLSTWAALSTSLDTMGYGGVAWIGKLRVPFHEEKNCIGALLQSVQIRERLRFDSLVDEKRRFDEEMREMTESLRSTEKLLERSNKLLREPR